MPERKRCRQSDSRQLQLDDEHEGTDEQEQPAHIRIGQDRDQRIDPAGSVDPDRPAPLSIQPLRSSSEPTV